MPNKPSTPVNGHSMEFWKGHSISQDQKPSGRKKLEHYKSTVGDVDPEYENELYNKYESQLTPEDDYVDKMGGLKHKPKYEVKVQADNTRVTPKKKR